MRHRLRSAICIAVVALAGIVVAGSGCGGQGEGQRCTSIMTGNAATDGTQECASGLICVSGNGNGNYPYDKCCPPPGTPATVLACGGNVDSGVNPSAGADAGFDVNTTTDAPSSSDGQSKDVKTEDAKTGDVVKDAQTDSQNDAADAADAATDDAADSAG